MATGEQARSDALRGPPCRRRVGRAGARSSERELRLYDGGNLAQPLATLTLDTSPSVLVPHYDEDTGVLFLWGRVRASLAARF